MTNVEYVGPACVHCKLLRAGKVTRARMETMTDYFGQAEDQAVR